jgi:hypothetical protein
MASKRRPARQEKLPATSLEEQERQLAAERQRIRAEMEQAEAFLKKVPQIKQEQERRQREEVLKKRATRVPPVSRRRSALPDNRHEYEYHAATAVDRRPKLRRERAQGRFTFFVLLIALLAVLAWAYTTFAGR